MEKSFDFNQVGKRMPYSVPDGFFDKLEADVRGLSQHPLNKEGGSAAQTVAHPSRWRGWGTALLAVAAAVALFFAVQPLLPKSSTDDFENVELAFNNLSTDDQDFLLEIYEDDDLFFNDSNDI